MKDVKSVLHVFVLAVLIFVLYQLAVTIRQIGNAAGRLPEIAERQIQLQGDETRKVAVELVDRQSAELRMLIVSELGNIRGLVRSELKNTRGLVASEMAKTRSALTYTTATIDVRLDAIQQDLNTQLSKAESDLNTQLTTLNSNIESSLKPVNAITAQVADAVPDFLVCYDAATGQGNPNCLFNWWAGIRQDSERTVQHTNETSVNVAKITEDIHGIITDFRRPKPWYKRLGDYLKVGIYGAANLLK